MTCCRSRRCNTWRSASGSGGLFISSSSGPENRLTAEGRQLHERAHEGADELRDGVRICRGLRIRSLRLGLIGAADVVEFHPGSDGTSRPFPVEYKRGRPKPGRWDEVQLCAQAMCLEEMLKTVIAAGCHFLRPAATAHGSPLRCRSA